MKRASKYIICESRDSHTLNAGSKAPDDVLSFLHSEGFVAVRIRYMERPRWYRPVLIPFYAIKLSRYLMNCDIAFFQHPYDTYHKALRKINSLAFLIAGKHSARKVALVHDIHTLRMSLPDVADEIKVLNQYDSIIVHSPAMKSFLTDNGCRIQQNVLGLFDYKVEKQYSGKRSLSKNVVFAGNLTKSVFLREIGDNLGGAKLFLYGSRSETTLSSALEYKGCFQPDDITGIEGSWGLVWDGDSAVECCGDLGEYLQYNSPHKASLYACARLPLIVPKNSAIAQIVLEAGIGLTISSLLELGDAIDGVSEAQYEDMLDNLNKIARRLTAGSNLKDSLAALTNTL